MAVLADVKTEWEYFRHDAPGVRFRNHRERMRHRSKTHSVIALVIGLLLCTAGVVFLFIPGPGLLFIAFGLGLVASHSWRLAFVLDRAEPALRRAGHATKQQWQALPGRAKLGVIVGIAMLAAAVCLAMWKFVVAAYVLG